MYALNWFSPSFPAYLHWQRQLYEVDRSLHLLLLLLNNPYFAPSFQFSLGLTGHSCKYLLKPSLNTAPVHLGSSIPRIIVCSSPVSPIFGPDILIEFLKHLGGRVESGARCCSLKFKTEIWREIRIKFLENLIQAPVIVVLALEEAFPLFEASPPLKNKYLCVSV